MTTCSNCGRSAGTITKGRTLFCSHCKHNMSGCPSPEEIAVAVKRIKEAAVEQMRKKGDARVKILEGAEA